MLSFRWVLGDMTDNTPEEIPALLADLANADEEHVDVGFRKGDYGVGILVDRWIYFSDLEGDSLSPRSFHASDDETIVEIGRLLEGYSGVCLSGAHGACGAGCVRICCTGAPRRGRGRAGPRGRRRARGGALLLGPLMFRWTTRARSDHLSGPSGSAASRHARRRPAMQDGRWCGIPGDRRHGPASTSLDRRARHVPREHVC